MVLGVLSGPMGLLVVILLRGVPFFGSLDWILVILGGVLC